MDSFYHFFDSNPAIMLLIDPKDGMIVNGNKSATEFYGYNSDLLCSLNISDLNILSKKEIEDQIDKIQKKEISSVIYKHKLCDNTLRDVKVLASPVELNNRKFNWAIIQDITEEIQNHKKLNRYFEIIDESIAFIGIADTERNITYLNKSMRKAFSISENADLTKIKTSEFYLQNNPIEHLDIEEGAFEKGNWIGENIMQTADGSQLPVIQSGLILKDSYGNPEFTSITAFNISKRKELESQINESEKFYKSLFNNLNGFVYCELIYSNGRAIDFEYILTNKAFEDQTGFKNLSGKRVSTIWPEIVENDYQLIQKYANVVETGNPIVFEVFHNSVNNWFQVKVERMEQNRFIASFELINERKKKELEIETLLSRYQTLLQISNDGIYVIDLNGRIKEVNISGCKMLGYSNSEMLQLNITDIVANKTKDEILRRHAQLLNNASIFQTKHLRKDGTIIDVEINAVGLKLEGVDYIYVSSRDISIQVKENEIRSKALDQLNKIASRVPGVLYQYVLRPDGSSFFPYASEGIREVYRITPQEVIQDASIVFNKIYIDDLVGVIQSINISAESLSPWKHEYRVKDQDGSIRLLSGNAIPQKESDGSILWHGFITDITEQKRAENILIELTDRFKHLFDLHSAVMLLIDAESGAILDANFAASKFYGYSREQMREMNIADFNTLNSAEIKKEIHLTINENKNYFVFQHKISNGKLIPVEVHTTQVNFEGRNTFFSIIHDISERVKNEELVLDYTNKLKQMNADLESFAYVASHDLKNPLNVANGFLGFLINKKDLSIEKREEYLKYIKNAVDQMKLLINDLLQFSRIGANNDSFVEVDSNILLQRIQEDLAENILQNNAKLIVHSLPAISANKTLVHELFINLISNALKYHKKDKPVIIEIGFQDLNDKYEFYVKDNGIGITPENLEKVFIMFKRLNAPSEYEGTGIGLALCKKIVDAHEGRIWVESVFGEGSTFFFTIKK